LVTPVDVGWQLVVPGDAILRSDPARRLLGGLALPDDTPLLGLRLCLLDSQLATLEEPDSTERALIAGVGKGIEDIVDSLTRKLDQRKSPA
jgi:hypothetical protein